MTGAFAALAFIVNAVAPSVDALGGHGRSRRSGGT